MDKNIKYVQLNSKPLPSLPHQPETELETVPPPSVEYQPVPLIREQDLQIPHGTFKPKDEDKTTVIDKYGSIVLFVLGFIFPCFWLINGCMCCCSRVKTGFIWPALSLLMFIILTLISLSICFGLVYAATSVTQDSDWSSWLRLLLFFL
ncbi:hypothetical protein EIN_246840 [Entamoeba invadens IP1]|uniref:Transmembrane protein n=1 Tax=Entamoeba invadens IP1 TaxID=370355 RepID=A0A0A1UDX2_ENTIV|nr:hypothetical protein EIN_246840 [Entamoeba invadens IP1]ELP94790.1 hypothetical protein EIN_246840 [Entamoeba invadens IP1]|eukprot:XP_004261561.1 hypothetical protein EIN_246840 [Entamoeba invadens IP1]